MKKPSIINAFTLIELVIVIGIIGLMVTIPVIAYSTVTKKSRDTRRKQDIDKVNTALMQYRTENGHFPIQTTYAGLADDLVPVFINNLPTDPMNNATFSYSYSADATGEYYTLGAVLENMNGSNNEIYYSTPSGGKTITGTPIPPTSFMSPTGFSPLNYSPTPSKTPTPSFTPTPTP